MKINRNLKKMKSTKSCILTINSGSSSIKFSLYEMESLIRFFYGEIENVGTKNTTLSFINIFTNQKTTIDTNLTNTNFTGDVLIDWIEKQIFFVNVKVIGHRIVHGMMHTEPEIVGPELLDELKEICDYDSEHLPQAIKLIELFRIRHPNLEQVACFDTSFHATMPSVAKLLPIPRRFTSRGVQRYGFHGLSYAYLLDELKRIAGNETSQGKIIFAHLGNGASLAATQNGKSIDTSMGFTPSSGLTMSTRAGDLDPGVAWYLMKSEKINPAQFNHIINHESGLLAISEYSSDMRELLKCQDTNSKAAEAIEFFCYQTKKWIGSFAAALGGLETLVFSGGIGQHAPEIRARISNGLQFLGIEIDEIKNSRNETVISKETSKISVYIINTNEELMIAKLVCQLLNRAIK